MKIVIAGGTGLVGKRLQKLFKKQNAEIVILTSSGASRIEDGIRYEKWLNGFEPHNLENATAFINLAGVSLNDARWTPKQKTLILDSRLQATTELIRIMRSLENKPKVFINASAVGIYQPSDINVYNEQDAQPFDFLSDVVYRWEEAASAASELGVRTCYMRFGVILEQGAGALPLMSLPYQLFIGGKIGSGKQWVSWIHAEDAARAIEFTMNEQSISGPINVVAPNPLRMNDFGKTLAEVMHRPHFIPVPSFALKLALGEKSTLILEGQHVVPEKLVNAGFQFSYPTLKEALKNLYK